MVAIKRIAMGVGTLGCAAGTAVFVSSGDSPADTPAPAPLVVEDIVQTAAVPAPALPTEAAAEPALPAAPIELAAVTEDAPIELTPPAEEDVASFDCAIDMTAAPVAGAMVDLTLTAPCLGSERVTFHHEGLMFTDVMPSEGPLTLTVPSMSENAMFIAAFGNGEGATALTEVPSLQFYDRVALQWKGELGLQLHAREFTQEYFGDGHVWAQNAGDLSAAALGEGGYMTRLGSATLDDALQAEVYSFPSGTAQKDGDILLTVEADVTSGNCATAIEAQTLQVQEDKGLRVRDMTLEIPDCEGVGDVLVLKNLLQNLTIAAK